MQNITITMTDMKYAEKYNKALNAVAAEEKFICSSKSIPVEKSENEISKILQNNWLQYLALDNEEVVGWCKLTPRNDSFCRHVGVLSMAVVKEYRSQGVGSLLLRKVIQNAKEHGFEKIELEVFSRNNDAVNFYYKNGFLDEGERKNSAKFCDGYDHLLCMGRFLG